MALSAKAGRGRRVLVTRPAHQADTFGKLLYEAGFKPVFCPTIAIAAPVCSEQAKRQLNALKSAEIAIFTSANAVHFAQRLVDIKPLLKDTEILAIGPATAKALEHIGLKATVPCDSYNSSGLLEMDTLQRSYNRSVVLVRGHGGFAALPETLRDRGAKLQLAEVYQRTRPEHSEYLKKIFHTELPHIISTTSNETLVNLVTLTPEILRPQMWRLPVIVNSERAELLARSSGFHSDILLARPAGDNGQIKTLKAWITEQ